MLRLMMIDVDDCLVENEMGYWIGNRMEEFDCLQITWSFDFEDFAFVMTIWVYGLIR